MKISNVDSPTSGKYSNKNLHHVCKCGASYSHKCFFINDLTTETSGQHANTNPSVSQLLTHLSISTSLDLNAQNDCDTTHTHIVM